MVDDRFKLALSLQVMKEQRHILIKDCKESNYELLHGLRKDVNSEVYKLYSEKYTILWLDAHWNRVCSLISENISYDKDIHDVIDFFVSEFKKFIDSMERNDVYSSVLFFENLKIKTLTLKNLIAISGKYEKSMQELLNAQEKHKIQYDKLLKEKTKENYGFDKDI